MIAWATVEDALFTWLTTSTGLAAGQVIWADQDGPRPDAPYISMTALALVRFGRDWLNVEDNGIDSDGIQAIVSSPYFQELCALRIKSNPVDDASLAQLEDRFGHAAIFSYWLGYLL